MIRVFAFLVCAFAGTAARAGINEGDAIFGTPDLLAVAAFGLVTVPIGFGIAWFGFSLLFKIIAWFLVLCLLGLAVAMALLAGEMAVILVVFAALVLVPGLACYLLGGWAGYSLRARRAGRAE